MQLLANYVNRCQRAEDNLHIGLDDEFTKDNGKSLLAKLTYTTDGQAHKRPLKCDIYFNAGSDLRAGMGSLKNVVSKYFEYCQKKVASQAFKSRLTTKAVKKDITATSTIIDS